MHRNSVICCSLFLGSAFGSVPWRRQVYISSSAVKSVLVSVRERGDRSPYQPR